MSKVYSINKGAVQTFSPAEDSSADVVEKTPQKAPIPDEQQLTQLLSALDAEKVRTILLNTFSEQLDELIENERQAAAEQIRQTIVGDADKQLQELKESMSAELSSQKQSLQQLLDNLSTLDCQIVLQDEHILLSLVCEAIEHLLAVKLGDPERIKLLIDQLATKYASQQNIHLLLSTEDFTVFSELEIEQPVKGRLWVEKAEGLEPGAFELKLDEGQVKSQFNNKLKELIQLLKPDESSATRFENAG